MKIIFCIPGKEFSNNFLMAWSELMIWCMENKIQFMISNNYSPVVYYARNKCLGGDVRKGIKQKPFDEKLSYDYIMWIDSDIIFNVEQLKKLIESGKDIVSGLYKMSDNKHYATVKDMDDEFFKKNGYYPFLKEEDIKGKELMEVDYTGFGWMLIKKGVFESLDYPWFRPLWTKFEMKDKIIEDFSSEDVGFCKLIREKGYKIYVHPEVIVGHEKKFVI